jgi:hypothetical protein
MTKASIKTFSTLTWVKKGRTFIRKESIESVNDEYLTVRTVGGMFYTFDTKKEFEKFTLQIGFNQPGQ